MARFVADKSPDGDSYESPSFRDDEPSLGMGMGMGMVMVIRNRECEDGELFTYNILERP